MLQYVSDEYINSFLSGVLNVKMYVYIMKSCLFTSGCF